MIKRSHNSFWENINSFKPNIFIMLGDNIYPEKNGIKLDKLAKAYDELEKIIFIKNSLIQFLL